MSCQRTEGVLGVFWYQRIGCSYGSRSGRKKKVVTTKKFVGKIKSGEKIGGRLVDRANDQSFEETKKNLFDKLLGGARKKEERRTTGEEREERSE